MRPFSFCLPLCFLLILGAPGAVAGEPPAGRAERVIGRACDAGARAADASTHAADEPPAWLLLASAVVLLGAGRLAGRP
ncbi:hypothetical protein [Massilia sp.]|uniref:hypothetical protein n=1 Tax=Massilia sp. TaxID=1882437 RepID=UPI00289E2582|nr:hypothetical protein [Massilia sp.]